jgi:hypothetical protein
MRRWVVLRAAAFALAGTLAAAAPPPLPARVAQYVLAESRTSVTPAGERASAVRGVVTVLGGTARWDLESGTFPRTQANAVVVGDRVGWLLDRKSSVAAPATLENVRELFVPPGGGDPGPFQAVVSEVDVPSAGLTKGPSFEGRATARLRVTASWSLVTSMPGRVSRVRFRLTSVVDALADPPKAIRSPLDDLGRLLDVPSPVREALAPELARVRGVPVGVVVETEAELAVDHPGTASPPSDGRAPLRTRSETTRTLSALATRPAAASDARALALPEEVRVVGLERLVQPVETLR